MGENLRRTPLHAAHTELGAKMVAFSGWHMPIQYAGILAEHRAVRGAAGVFDVSHMGEVDFRGADALRAVQRLVSNDAAKLADGRALYTVTCNERGGIVDDCIVYRFGAEHFRIVVNASNVAKDFAHFVEHAGDICAVDNRSDEFALIAVQGPRAMALLETVAGAHLGDVPSFGLAQAQCAGVPVTAARTGYTGEDGMELFVSSADARAVWDAVVTGGAAPIGLGARDTLRLEARLCLYGNDIDETTNPYEAGLGWVVKLDKGEDFVGRAALVKAKADGVSRRLVGFKVEGRGIVRANAEVLGERGDVVGRVTSGGVAPTIGGAVGMAYVPKPLAGEGKPLQLRQRGKQLPARQVKGPFYRRS